MSDLSATATNGGVMTTTSPTAAATAAAATALGAPGPTAAVDTGATGHGWLVVLGVLAVLVILVCFAGRSLLTCCGCLRRRPKLHGQGKHAGFTTPGRAGAYDKDDLVLQDHWADFDPRPRPRLHDRHCQCAQSAAGARAYRSDDLEKCDPGCQVTPPQPARTASRSSPQHTWRKVV